jgi:hypothetical protein
MDSPTPPPNPTAAEPPDGRVLSRPSWRVHEPWTLDRSGCPTVTDGLDSVFTRSSWLHPTKSDWPHHANSSFSWPHSAGAGTSCNFPGRAPFPRCQWPLGLGSELLHRRSWWGRKNLERWGRNKFAESLDRFREPNILLRRVGGRPPTFPPEYRAYPASHSVTRPQSATRRFGRSAVRSSRPR